MSRNDPGERERARAPVARGEADAVSHEAAAAHAACDRAFKALFRWIGATGASALFTRARAQTMLEHPSLREIRLRQRPEPGLEGVTQAIQEFGATEATVGLRALLAALLDLLGRLVGDDMAARLMEHDLPRELTDDESRR